MEQKKLEEIVNGKEVEQEDPFEILFYGSPNKTANFAFVEGKKMPYDRNLFINKMDNQSISLSLLYKFPLRHLGPEYTNFYNVALPCNDLIYKTTDAELEKCDPNNNQISKNNKLPDSILDKCMVKIRKDLKGDYVGYQSGGRSAIIKYSGKYYRLKGCGNWDVGFNNRNMGFPKGAVDVRGCQFRHTAYREVYMSDRINEVLMKYGFEVNNKPIGIWLYGDVENKEKGILNDKKRIDKFCSVYEVVSEKRLGCQLIPGLEVIIFDYLLEFLKMHEKDEEFLKNYKETIAELFDGCKNRVVRKKVENSEANGEESGKNCEKEIPSEIKEIEQTVNYIPIIELNREEGDTINSLFDKYNIYSNRDSDGELINLFELLDKKSSNPFLKIFEKEHSDLLSNFLKNYFKENNIYSIFTDNVNKNSIQIIDDKIKSVISALNENKFKLLEIIGLIFARTGWESGRLKRIMQDNNINWGTYEDQPYRLHCNAHTDNYTIYPKNYSKNKNLICILDFDLAFLKENFINIANENDPETYGSPDDFLFDSYLNMERQHLEWEFAGLENVISFDFYKEEMKNESVDFVFKAFLSLMRDTAVLHFRDGYVGKEFEYKEKYEQLYDNLYDVVELALLVSHDYMDKEF